MNTSSESSEEKPFFFDTEKLDYDERLEMGTESWA